MTEPVAETVVPYRRGSGIREVDVLSCCGCAAGCGFADCRAVCAGGTGAEAIVAAVAAAGVAGGTVLAGFAGSFLPLEEDKMLAAS